MGLMDQIQEQIAEQIPADACIAPANPKPWLWKPGQSGNPGGRPRTHVVQLARKHTDAAIAALAEALANPRERTQAAAVLLDRGWGKATQPLEHTGADGGPIEHVVRDTRQTIDAFIAEWREVPAEDSNGGA